MSEKYKEASNDVVEFFEGRMDTFVFSFDIKFICLCDNKQKQLVKLTKIPEQYAILLKKDLLVTINEEYFDAFSTEDEEVLNILFDKEIDKIETNADKGTFKINNNASFSANIGFIEKYSYEKVKRSIEIEQLFEEQKKDKNNQ